MRYTPGNIVVDTVTPVSRTYMRWRTNKQNGKSANTILRGNRLERGYMVFTHAVGGTQLFTVRNNMNT